jgi:hypothetical protein
MARLVAPVTFQLSVLDPPGEIVDGVAVNELMTGAEGTLVTWRDCVLATPFNVAVNTAVWELLAVPAAAAKEPEALPAGTITEAGTVTIVLLLDSATAVPPAGAALVSTTLHALDAPLPMLVGVQLSALSAGGARTETVAVLDRPPQLAVITTDTSDVTGPADAVKDAETLPPGIATEAGTLSAGLLLARLTAAPPAGAAAVNATVHAIEPAPVNDAGEQASEVSAGPCAGWMRTAPLPAEVAIPAPSGLALTGAARLTGEDTAGAAGAIVRAAYATAPLGIAVRFNPVTRHVIVPELALQFTALPAAVTAGAGVTLTAAKCCVE